MRTERFYVVIVVATSVVVIASHVLGATVMKGVLWGTHFYGFFPSAVLGLALAATVVAALTIDARLRARAPLATTTRDPSTASRVVVPAVLAVLAAVVFWAFRIRHTLLGDSGALSQHLPLGERMHLRQPLSLLLHHEVYEWARRLFEAPLRSPHDVAFDTVALESVVAGALFVPVAIALARRLVARDAGEADGGVPSAPVSVSLAAGLLLAQGYLQLFFGYVENYTWFTLALALYLWAGLSYLRGRAPLILASLALATAVGLNLSGLVVLPSLVLLAAWGLMRPSTRAAALRDSLLTLVLFVGVPLLLASFGGFSLREGLDSIWNMAVRGEHTDKSAAYLVSRAHLRDFFAFQMLMGPLAALLLVPLGIQRLASRDGRDAPLVFLLAAAVPAFVASWINGDTVQGLPRDWDVFAPFALLSMAAAIYCLASARLPATIVNRLLALALVVSVFHTGAWVALNTSAPRSLERYKTLPISRGRPEMVVGYWYLTHGQKDQAREWFERSVAVYPGNNTAQYQLGLFAMDEARYEEAVKRFAIAVQSRPDKPNYRLALVDALVLARHPVAAAPELERLLEIEPGRADYWGCYGIVLSGLGRTEEARAAFARAAALAPREPRFTKLAARLGDADAFDRAVREDWDALVVK
jgi:tetratricopeptide (TPR) repeat protein